MSFGDPAQISALLLLFFLRLSRSMSTTMCALRTRISKSFRRSNGSVVMRKTMLLRSRR